MIDLHTHSLLSDGVLIPSELSRRCEAKGLQAIAITDHIDSSNIENVISGIVRVCTDINKFMKIKVIPGVEITHVPPGSISLLASSARKMGAKIVIVHGETIVEPVIEGTNHAAVNSDIDILAHPGLITKEDILIAKKNNIFLEISCRKGHSYTNGHVARIAAEHGASLVINSDAHEPCDLLDYQFTKKIAFGASITDEYFKQMQLNSKEIVKRILKLGDF